MRLISRTAVVFLLGSALSPAANLSPDAARAFQTYITSLETRLARQQASPAGFPGARAGEGGPAGAVRIEPVNGGSWQVSGGLLHHWRAAALVPGAGLQDALALLRDYNRLAQYYAPEVVSSHTLAGQGNMATVAMRFRKECVVTVVLDAEFENQSGMAGPGRGYSYRCPGGTGRRARVTLAIHEHAAGRVVAPRRRIFRGRSSMDRSV